jgi:predicted enzyme related to lactoylglutathione lyase
MVLRCNTAFITLATPHLAALVQFYSQLLDQAPQPWIPEVYAEFHLSALRLGLFQPKPHHQSEFTAPSSGGMSLCLEVENLEDAIAQFTALGCPPPGPVITASHGREIYAYDPDGNRVILHQGHS